MKEIGVITKRNVDNNGNSILLDINGETKQVLKGLIFLNEVPSFAHRVKINNMVEIPYDKPITQENQFKVHYTFGFICFHPNQEGKNIIITNYKGIGYALIDSSRVVTKWTSDGKIEETLDTVIDRFDFKAQQLLTRIEEEWREQSQKASADWTSFMSKVNSEWISKKNTIDTEWTNKKNTIDTEFNTRKENMDKFLSDSEDRMDVINEEHQQNIDNIQDAIHNKDNNFKVKFHEYVADRNVDHFIIPASEFNEVIDNISMFYRGAYLHKGEQYNIVGSRVTLIGWTLNKDEVIQYQILRSGELPPLDSAGAITRPMLSPDLQQDIDGLNNQSFIINAANWTKRSDGLYEYTLQHGRNSKNLIVEFYHTVNDSELLCTYEYVSFDSIKIITDEAVETKVIIAVSYFGYQGEIHNLSSFSTKDLIQTNDKQYMSQSEKDKIKDLESSLDSNTNDISLIEAKLDGFYNLKDFENKALDGDWSLAINYAFTVCDKLFIPKGSYTCKSKITIRQNKTIEGSGQYNTTLLFENLNEDCAIEIVYNYFGSSSIKGVFIQSNNSGCDGVVLRQNSTNNRTVFGFNMDSVSVRGFRRNIIQESLATYSIFNRVYSDQATDYNLYIVSGFANLFTNCRFASSKNNGVYCRAGEQNFINCAFEGNARKGLYVLPNGGKISLKDCFFEMLDSTNATTLLHVDSPFNDFEPLRILNIDNCHFYGATNSMYLVGLERLNMIGSTLLSSFGNREIVFSSSNQYAIDWYFKGNKIDNDITKQVFTTGDYGTNKLEFINFSSIPTASVNNEGRFIYTTKDGHSEIRCCMLYADGSYGWKVISSTQA